MPRTLDDHYHRLIGRLSRAEAGFTRFVITTPQHHYDRLFALEGLISTTWQAWSGFCRDLLISSAIGTVTRSGIHLANSVTPPTSERVSYIAVKDPATTLKPASTNSFLWKEPTWGDVAKASSIATRTNPKNLATLLSAFGAVTRGPMHLQKVRNATAHLNYQSFAEVRALSVFYNANPIRHPALACLWVDPGTRDFAFLAWLDEMRIVADLATR
jgi:hypothetical protein